MYPYLPKLRETFPRKTDAEIELMLSDSANLRQRTGVSAYEHRKRGMQRMFPSRIWHEWREERMQSVQYCLENGIQELGWMGSSSSNKTGDLADTAYTLYATNPESTTVLIASPYEKATLDGVWTELLERFEEAKEKCPSLPGEHKRSEDAILTGEKFPKGMIKVVTVDKIGKLIGKKARNTEGGLLVLMVDELSAFDNLPAQRFLHVTQNLWSNKRVLIIATGNFSNVGDGFGVYCDPSEQDIPGGYERFDPDRHFRWRSKRGGLILRFDGLQSPNVKAGYDKYDFVTRIAYIEKMAGQPGGLKSAASMKLIRSAPVLSLDEKTVVNGERIRAGGCYDPFEWTADPLQKIAFADLGFGGDDCVIQKFHLGYQRLVDGGKRQVLALWGEPYVVPVQIGKLDAVGKEVPVNDQVVAGIRAHVEQHGIPLRNAAYDGSMRPGVAHVFAAKWSTEVEPIDSSGNPTDRPVSATEKHDSKKGAPAAAVKWKERADRLLTEFWFAAATLIDGAQLKNLHLSPKAADQLCSRRWDWKGKSLHRVETKQEYKEGRRLMGKSAESPNEADALVGGVEKARRMGLQLNGVTPNGGAVAMVRDYLQRIQAQNVRSYAQGGRFQDLPAGRPKYMAGETDFRGGRLHQV